MAARNDDLVHCLTEVTPPADGFYRRWEESKDMDTLLLKAVLFGLLRGGWAFVTEILNKSIGHEKFKAESTQKRAEELRGRILQQETKSQEEIQYMELEWP